MSDAALATVSEYNVTHYATLPGRYNYAQLFYSTDLRTPDGFPHTPAAAATLFDYSLYMALSVVSLDEYVQRTL